MENRKLYLCRIFVFPKSSTIVCGNCIRLFHRNKGEKFPQRQALRPGESPPPPKPPIRCKQGGVLHPTPHKIPRFATPKANLQRQKILVAQDKIPFPQFPPPIRILLLVFSSILMSSLLLSSARTREALPKGRIDPTGPA